MIHTVGPIYHSRNQGTGAGQLASCYRKSLEIAVEHDLKSIVCSDISGTYTSSGLTRSWLDRHSLASRRVCTDIRTEKLHRSHWLRSEDSLRLRKGSRYEILIRGSAHLTIWHSSSASCFVRSWRKTKLFISRKYATSVSPHSSIVRDLLPQIFPPSWRFSIASDSLSVVVGEMRVRQFIHHPRTWSIHAIIRMSSTSFLGPYCKARVLVEKRFAIDGSSLFLSYDTTVSVSGTCLRVPEPGERLLRWQQAPSILQVPDDTRLNIHNWRWDWSCVYAWKPWWNHPEHIPTYHLHLNTNLLSIVISRYTGRSELAWRSAPWPFSRNFSVVRNHAF